MKTIEEAAKDILRWKYSDFDKNEWNYKSELEMLLHMSKITQRWISVEEELPEDSKFVLAKSKKDNIAIGLYSLRIGWASSFNSENITHWRPIELK